MNTISPTFCFSLLCSSIILFSPLWGMNNPLPSMGISENRPFSQTQLIKMPAKNQEMTLAWEDEAIEENLPPHISYLYLHNVSVEKSFNARLKHQANEALSKKHHVLLKVDTRFSLREALTIALNAQKETLFQGYLTSQELKSISLYPDSVCIGDAYKNGHVHTKLYPHTWEATVASLKVPRLTLISSYSFITVSLKKTTER